MRPGWPGTDCVVCVPSSSCCRAPLQPAGQGRSRLHVWRRAFSLVPVGPKVRGSHGPQATTGATGAPYKVVPVQASPRVVRWALKLAAYSYQLVYRPGKDLGPADAMSRLPLPEVPAAVPEPAEVFMLEHVCPKVPFRSLVPQATNRDPVLSHVVKAVFPRGGVGAAVLQHKATELSLEQGCLWVSRVVIPQSNRSRVLQLLHAGHPGVGKARRWPGPTFGVLAWTRTSLARYRDSESTRNINGPRVFASLGLPDVIVSDNVPAFASTEYLAWLTKNSIRRMVVPPYNPPSNGSPKRVVQAIKDKLKKSQADDVTPPATCELLPGQMAKTPFDILHPDLRSMVLLKQLKQKLAADRRCRPAPLPVLEMTVIVDPSTP
ncbi:hypothetical protein MTO96_025587 [Rhipicephalus appendiculatus]